MCWIDIYLDPLNEIAHDAVNNLIARDFQLNAGMMKIDTKPIPIESTNSMTYVELYHAPLRRTSSIIRAEIQNLSDEDILLYATKALNDSVGTDG